MTEASQVNTLPTELNPAPLTDGVALLVFVGGKVYWNRGRQDLRRKNNQSYDLPSVVLIRKGVALISFLKFLLPSYLSI